MAKKWKWSAWRTEWRAARPLKHAEVKGEPVAGTGKRRRRYVACRCDWCIWESGIEGNRTRRERKARRYEDEAN